MSIDATSWAWAQALRPSHKLVLLSLADRAGERHQCWPSVERLRLDTGLDVKTVRASLRELCAQGLITREETPGRSSLYTLMGVRGRERRSGTPDAGPHGGPDGTPDAGPDLGPTMGATVRTGVGPGMGASASPAPSGPPSVNGRGPGPEPGLPPCRNRTGRAAGIGPLIFQEPTSNRSVNRKRGDGPPVLRLGEFGNVRLSPAELERLEAEYGPDRARAAVAFLDLHLGAKKGGDPYRSHYLALRKWVFDALAERQARQARALGQGGAPVRSFQELQAENAWAEWEARRKGEAGEQP